MKKKCFVILITIFIFISLSFYVFIIQYRHFIQIENNIFTFWKTKNGCYIMPYKYYGLTIPKNNYIKAVNRGGIIIFLGNDSRLYIFPEFTYIRGAETLEINLKTYDYFYFPYPDDIDNISTFNNKIKLFKDKGYPYTCVYIQEMYATFGNTKINNLNKFEKRSKILFDIAQTIIINIGKERH